MQRILMTLDNLKNLNLFKVAGLAVANDKIEAYMLGDNIKETIANKSLNICEPGNKGAVCIKAIYLTTQGLIVKVEGVTQINKEASSVIGALAHMMVKQNLAYACFPGISSGASNTFHTSDDSLHFKRVAGITDLQVYGEKILCLHDSDQRQLHSTTITEMNTNLNWKNTSKVECVFQSKVRGLGRIDRQNDLMVTLVDNKIMTHNLATGVTTCLKELAPDRSIAQGFYRLCDKVDHNIQLFVDNIKMTFVPATASATAAG